MLKFTIYSIALFDVIKRCAIEYKSMKKAAFLTFAVLLLIHQGASAWQWETHSTLAEKVCRDFDCGCVAEIRNAAIIPDRDFRDNINHHCYNVSESCNSSKDYTCPKKNHCPALQKMESWINAAQNKQGCEKWKNIGIASHYFFDSKVFWHKVQNEDYKECHEPFEGAVEKKFEANDGSNWTIEACGAEENYRNIVEYVKEFEDILTKRGEEKKEETLLLPECGWWCKVRIWLLVIF